jgi:benzodiazapine receptor
MTFVKAIISIVIAQSAGLLGTLFTRTGISSWYSFVNKPSFNPPSWIFGPVWTILYTLMGISSFLIWQVRDTNPLANKALIVYGVHLVFNTLWTILFFGLKNPALAFFEIIFLWLLIILTIVLFYQINKTAGLLLIPYLLWVSFAAVLNYSIWRLN